MSPPGPSGSAGASESASASGSGDAFGPTDASGSADASDSVDTSGSPDGPDSLGPSWSPLVVVAIADALPWRAVLLDLLVVAAWVLAVSVAFRQADLPSWLYYVVAIGGVVVYSLLDVPWPSVGGDDAGE